MSRITEQDRNRDGSPSRIRYCHKHRGTTGQDRLDMIRAFGMGGFVGDPCVGLPCRLYPGTDYISPRWIA